MQPRFLNLIISYDKWYEVIATPKNVPMWEVAFLIDGNQAGPSRMIHAGEHVNQVCEKLMHELNLFAAGRTGRR